jgi:hypothetical protein
MPRMHALAGEKPMPSITTTPVTLQAPPPARTPAIEVKPPVAPAKPATGDGYTRDDRTATITEAIVQADRKIAALEAKKADLQARFDAEESHAAFTGSWGVALLSVGTSLIPASISGNQARSLGREIAKVNADLQQEQARKLAYVELLGR